MKVPALLFRCTKSLSAIALSLALISCAEQAQDSVKADMVFINSKVYTVDKQQPLASAVAIKDGKILAVGETDTILKLAGASTTQVDLKGKLLMPSFGDAHVHPVYGGLSYARCSMHSGESLEDYQAIIKKCVDETEADRWVYGVGWMPGLFPPDGVPRKEILDEISSDRPLVFRSTGGHSLWVNSKALELAGITKETKDPYNGRIDRDPETGELLGGLQESAMELVNAYLSPPTEQDLANAIEYSIHHFNTLGITNILDAGVAVDETGNSPIVNAYLSLQEQQKLTVNAEVAVKWNNEKGVEQIPALEKAAGMVKGDFISNRTLKIWIDGVIAQGTAAMLVPYADAPEHAGAPTMSSELLNEVVAEFDKSGYQVMIHAIGDKGIRMSLDAFAYAREQNGTTGNLHQITHAEFITPPDITRFAELGITANFQPLWSTMDPYMQLTAKRVGEARMQYVYPAHSVLEAGGKMVYGSDWSVASANPLYGIEVALTRRTPGRPDAAPLLPDEGVTLEQAVEAYTIAVARINHNDNRTGSITVGKDADLVVLDQDIFTVPTYDIGKTKVMVTLFRGQPVYGSVASLQ